VPDGTQPGTRFRIRHKGVPVLNGGNQKVPAAAKFGTLRERKGRSSVSLDMSAAYPACERVVRHIALSAGRYVTIDVWEDLASYRTFSEANAEEYKEIDRRCDALTEQERCLGFFETS